MVAFPKRFDAEAYCQWHEHQFPADAPLRVNLERRRTEMKGDAFGDLMAISKVLYSLGNYCARELAITRSIQSRFEIPLVTLFQAPNPSQGVSYDRLFKTVDSVVNKLWRKNVKRPEVTLSNLTERITDLIRTEVIAPSLGAAQYLSTRLNAAFDFLDDPRVREAAKKTIHRLEFAPEMKMETGYFAYHGLVYFHSGRVVEVQIYSQMSYQWRQISHRLYERRRVSPEQPMEFDTPEARLISLGHLLHLAECEVEKLLREEPKPTT